MVRISNGIYASLGTVSVRISMKKTATIAIVE